MNSIYPDPEALSNAGTRPPPHPSSSIILKQVNLERTLRTILPSLPHSDATFTNMTVRPTLNDLRSKSYDTTKSGLPSPRITHFDGDIPPQMSPLDAFAAQSRMLAKKLDDSKRNGRRVSRLPPLTVAESLVKPASAYPRSRSAETQDGTDFNSPRALHDAPPLSNLPELEEPSFRPNSYYPRFSSIRTEEDDQNSEVDSPKEQAQQAANEYDFKLRYAFQPQSANEHFATPRVGSSEPLGPVRNGIKGRPGSPITPQLQPSGSPQFTSRPSFDQTHRRTNSQQRALSVESAQSPGPSPSTLAPPKSPNIRQAASIRSVPMDSSDDELSASTGGSSFSQHRKQSSSSGVSVPRSPFCAFTQPHARSPSLNSEHSIGGSRLARPMLNFSRPLSRGSSRPSLEVASRQPSFDSRPSFDYNSRQPSSESQSFFLADLYGRATASPDQEQYFDPKEHPDAPAPSYIYTKFSLPRGRILQRDSKVLENQQLPRFEWEQPAVATNVAPVTPPTNEKLSSTQVSPPPPPKTNLDSKTSLDIPRSSFEKSRLGPNRPPIKPLSTDTQSSSSASMRSGSTIKARPNQPASSTQELTSEDHLAKGIASHESGNFKESTYHLRIAAKANLPTAMLLYALACRHGWGMRPNPSEGVQWLRRAADCASLEIADDEDGKKEGKVTDVQQQKTRRAQFALSIYELGVSHMNGWGIEQDKALALRCFEIAGNWGDADAMAEAGFCYTQGSGCKKDLMKAAKWYRMAEAKGMSMVGNSWIYKPKYADASGERKGRKEKPTTPEKKPRDKSRTRTIFGRKKS
ncbi:MAG: hypothetical protein Q9226_008696, partial [Calogaya cf. arnoldii]